MTGQIWIDAMTDPDLDLEAAAESEALEEPLDERLLHRPRHPGDFDEWPSDEQMEYFKRGGR